MERIYIGVLGLGNIGSALVERIEESKEKIRKLFSIELIIKRIYVRDVNKKRDICVDNLPLTTSIEEVINDTEIDIICECMGGNGAELTYKFIKQSILEKKGIVMSSKKVLSLHGLDLLKIAEHMNVDLKYDATVGGGIPVAKIIETSFWGDKIVSAFGIVNATSNFICSEMFEKHMTIDQALEIAVEQGYAENDPSEDIDGYDALYKASVISMFCFGKSFDIKSAVHHSINELQLSDVIDLQEIGYSIKPIFYIEDCDETLNYYIGPSVIPTSISLGGICENNNIICFNGNLVGQLGFIGQGAGKEPTACCMFDDLINLIVNRRRKTTFSSSKMNQFKTLRERKDSYYLHIRVPDVPGEISWISKICSDEKVNIDKIVTKGKTAGLYDVFLFISCQNKSEIPLTKLLFRFKQMDVETKSILPCFHEF